MIAKKLEQLMKKIAPWFEKTIPEARLSNDVEGRTWFMKDVQYTDTLKLEDLKKATDRESLNSDYKERFNQEKVKSRKGISAIKTEISALYSFNKCFVQRYKGRMHFYRDDLSQKGARNMRAAAQAMGVFNEFKKNLD
jgi:alpha-amylase/alpha-mannosidase (GH57 family)